MFIDVIGLILNSQKIVHTILPIYELKFKKKY